MTTFLCFYTWFKTTTFLSSTVRLNYNRCHSEPEGFWMPRTEGITLYLILQVLVYFWSNKSRHSLSLVDFFIFYCAIKLGPVCWRDLERLCLHPEGRMAHGVLWRYSSPWTAPVGSAMCLGHHVRAKLTQNMTPPHLWVRAFGKLSWNMINSDLGAQ